MANHPNRNWRKRAAEAADKWIAFATTWNSYDSEFEARVTAGNVRKALHNAFIAGFDAGRKPPAKPGPTE